MTRSKLLAGAAALALLVAAPSASFAFGRGGGGGHGAPMGGGGMHMGGGGGMHMGGGGATGSPGRRHALHWQRRRRAVCGSPDERPVPAQPGPADRTAWNGGGNWQAAAIRRSLPSWRASSLAPCRWRVIGGALAANSYAYYGGPDYYDPATTYYDNGYTMPVLMSPWYRRRRRCELLRAALQVLRPRLGHLSRL